MHHFFSRKNYRKGFRKERENKARLPGSLPPPPPGGQGHTEAEMARPRASVGARPALLLLPCSENGLLPRSCLQRVEAGTSGRPGEVQVTLYPSRAHHGLARALVL